MGWMVGLECFVSVSARVVQMRERDVSVKRNVRAQGFSICSHPAPRYVSVYCTRICVPCFECIRSHPAPSADRCLQLTCDP
jgi:hypothetical protein